MREIGTFNKISDALRSKIIPLGPKDTVEYQLLEKVKIQDPHTGKIETRYPHRQMYAKDTIYDPGANGGTGGLVDIGVPAVAGIDVKNQTVNLCEKFEFERPRDGILTLSGSIAFHRELDEYLQISNGLQDGVLAEDRDGSVPLLYRRIDHKKEARKKNESLKIKRDVFVYLSSMTVDDMRDFAAAMNWEEYKADPEILEAKISEFSDKEPQKFNDEVTSPLYKRKAAIKKALGVTITYDPVNHAMKWRGGETIASMERKAGENEVTAFAKWLATAGTGDKIFSMITKKKQPEPVAIE